MKGLYDWLNTHSEEHGSEALNKLWNNTTSYKSGYEPNVERGHAKFLEKLNEGNSPARVVQLKKPFSLLRIAAAVAVLLACGMLFNKYMVGTSMDSLATDSAEKKEIKLIDGSEITLNGQTRLTYFNELSAASRVVNLNGEGYFNIERDETKPFIIETTDALVKVLGTSFNVRSYSEEDFLEVFVESGKVAVQLNSIDKSIELNPGDLLVFDKKQGDYRLSNDSDQNSLAWKSGELKFTGKPLTEIFSALEKLHNVKISAENADLSECKYTFNPKMIDLNSIILDLEAACDLIFTETQSGSYQVVGSCCD